MRFGYILYILLAVLFASTCAHAAPELLPGEYITQRGWGNLELKQGKKGDFWFDIDAVGGNGHTCSLSGEVRGGRSIMEGEDGKPCIVEFFPTGKGINVTENDDACRYYCGARVRFSGEYLKPKTGCDSASVKKTRKEFKRLYDKGEFALARVKLEPLLKTCSDTILWDDLGRVRNDLAITLYKLGEYSVCREVLHPLEEDARKSDDELRQSYPPADAANAITIARATRTNLGLCTSVRPPAGKISGPAEVFKPALAEIKGRVKIPVLLPTKLPGHINPSELKWVRGTATATGYQIELYYDACGNACFAAEFNGSSEVVRKVRNSRPVTLPNGIKAMFRPVSCGGSCAPANLWWEQGGAMYQIQIKLPSTMSKEAQEKILAETAASVTAAKP